jgi:hypothetical protein
MTLFYCKPSEDAKNFGWYAWFPQRHQADHFARSVQAYGFQLRGNHDAGVALGTWAQASVMLNEWGTEVWLWEVAAAWQTFWRFPSDQVADRSAALARWHHLIDE